MARGNGEVLLVLGEDRERQRMMQRHQAFVGQLAHELRTPLTGLIAHTAIVRSAQTPEQVRAASAETIEREVQRLDRLVRDLLELHRIEIAGELARRPCNLLLIAEACIAQLLTRAEQQGMELALEASAPLPPVLAHPDRLTQVFLSLLDNALKYCRPGDRIGIRLAAEPAGVSCTVYDSGPGIAAEHLPRLAERLYRARTDVPGNGLGLALVREILRQHEASLAIESSVEPPQTGTALRWVLAYSAGGLKASTDYADDTD